MLRLEASLKGRGAPSDAYIYLFVANQEGRILECNAREGVLVNVDRLITGKERPHEYPFFLPATPSNIASGMKHPGINPPEKWYSADEVPLIGVHVYTRTSTNAASVPSAKRGLISASKAAAGSPLEHEPGDPSLDEPSHRRKSAYAHRSPRKTGVQYETRVGGFLLPTTILCDAYYAMITSPDSVPRMKWSANVVDDAVEYLIRTTLVSAASRPVDDNLHVQHGWRVEFTMRKVNTQDQYAASIGLRAWNGSQRPYKQAEVSVVQGTNAENARIAATFIAEYVRGFAPFRSPDAQRPYPGVAIPRFDLSSDGRSRRRHRRRTSDGGETGSSEGSARFKYADIVKYYTSTKRCKSPRGLGTLTSRTSNVLAMHMPTATTPIGLVPLGEFHYQTLLPGATARDLDKFSSAFERVLHTQCIAVGLASSEETTGTSHTGVIDNFTKAVAWAASVELQHTRTVTPELCTIFYMACDALARALVEFSVHVKYRGDYSFLRNGVTIPVERQDLDGITGASGSGDCEDVAAMTQCVAHAVLLGPTTDGSTRATSSQTALSDDPAWNTIRAAFGTHGRFRPVAWGSRMIRAAQVLLSHYVPTVILGSVTDSFPGTSKVLAAGIQALDLETEQAQLRSAAQKLAAHYPKPLAKPATDVALSAAAADVMGPDALLPAFVYDSDMNNASTVVAHQYGMLVPLGDALAMWCSAGGAHVPRLQKLNTAYTDELDASPLVYPALVLESTSRNSPYVVGASVYMTEVANRLVELGREDEARVLLRYVENKISPAERKARGWFAELHKSGLLDLSGGEVDGVSLNFRDTHSLRIVAGDLETRRGTAFYREVLHVSSPWIMTLAYPDVAESVASPVRALQLFKDPSSAGVASDYFDYMSLCVVDKESEFWGVPLERVLRPSRADTITLVSAIAGQSVGTNTRTAFHVSAFEGPMRVQPPSAMGRLSAPIDIMSTDRVYSIVGKRSSGGDKIMDYSRSALGEGTGFENIRVISLVREYDGPDRAGVHARPFGESVAWKKLERFVRKNKKYSIVHMTHSPAGYVLSYSPETLTVYISIVQPK